MPAAATTTLFEAVRDEVSAVATELEKKSERGTPRREFTNGLLRDLWVVQQMAVQDPKKFDDLAFLEPWVGQFLAKLDLVPGFFPEDGARAKAAAEKVRALVGGRSNLAALRELARPLVADAAWKTLHADARAELEATRVREALGTDGALRAVDGAAPADVQVAARLHAGLALHVAHALAEGQEPGAPERALREVEAWLEGRGATADRPAIGAAAPEGARVVAGKQSFVGAARGMVGVVAGAGFSWTGKRVSRPTVVLSSGAQAHVVGAVHALLDKMTASKASDAGAVRRVLPTLKALEARTRRVFDDAKADPRERANAALDLVEAVQPIGVLADPASLATLVDALARDFDGQKVELVVPTPGQKLSGDATVREVFSYDVAPGVVVEVGGLGMRIAGDLVRKPTVLVSKGAPPAGAVDEIIQLLPEGEVGKAYRDRLKLARLREDELARALAELVVEGRHEDLANAAQRAMKALVDAPPAQLADIEGWTELHDFLEKNLDALIDDGAEGARTAHRLLRPYLQGLTQGRSDEPRLRSIAESLTAVLGLYGEEVTQATRNFVFSELSKLRAGALADSSHARRLARSIAHGFRIASTGDNPAAAKDLITALASAGIKVYPPEPGRLGLCPDADWLFHRLELRHEEGERGKILGAFDPAVVVGQATETGSIALCLGKPPRLLDRLRSELVQGSRLRPALPKIEAKVLELERVRFVAELAGDATADRTFARELSKFFAATLREVGWTRNEADREALTQVFDALREDWKIELLPGYLTYRQLRALGEQHGDKVKVEVKEATSREVVLDGIGAIFRDEVLEPLQMTWKVGKAPAYVGLLKQVDWFGAVLDGKSPRIPMPPRVQEAILDFTSPDAGSVDALVRSLQVIVTWLAQDHPAEADKFLDVVKNAPGLELDFAPLPGKAYPREQVLKLVDGSKTPGNIAVVIDATKPDGTAVQVPQIAVFRDGHRISEEPRATFALQSASASFDGYARAIEPLTKSSDVLPSVKAEVQHHRTRLALVAPGAATQAVEVDAFKTLHAAHLVDPGYGEPSSDIQKAGAYLTGVLQKSGVLKVERFDGQRKLSDLQAPEGGLVVREEFCNPGMPEVLAVERPLVVLEGKMLQPALVRKGIPSAEEEAVQLDRVLNDALMKISSYAEGPGKIVEALLDEKGQQILPRTTKRIEEVRQKMLEALKASKKAMPTKTSLRDLLMFIIDQIHRFDDALALVHDRTHRGVYADRVFRDVVFRVAGPYLSQTHGISIDTQVVAGADVSVLTGRYKKETAGPKPKRVNNIIFSVVTPAFSQAGTNVRPATVRVGEY